jgi:hypothetical protein
VWVISCLGEIEEWILLALLPDWTRDLRGLSGVLKVKHR